jgi:23S rRNA-/tRNA-specific pseudouridylate synthase
MKPAPSGTSAPQNHPLFEFLSDYVCHEGDGFIVVNKPSGWPTQGTVDRSRDHLFAAVQRWQKTRAGKEAYVGLHHRLDRETSGLVLFTTDRRRNLWASQLFQQRQIQKTYMAICICPADISDHF